MTIFLTGVAAGLAIAMPPGAITALIVQTGLRAGFRPALAAGLGAATVDLCYVSLAVGLGAAIVPVLGPAEGPLRLAAGFALLAIGLLGALRARRIASADRRAAGSADLVRTYLRFIALTLVNPATLAYFGAIALGLGSDVLANIPAFVTGVVLASAAWQSLLAVLGGSLHGRLDEKLRAIFALIANIIVMILGLRIILPG
ncbi:MAG TPA: LysE family transporter [Candidatus Saccharimonadales bacterium]|nr:LysE family transporter [Candidatus Saccharimonadales bacterium]